MIESPSHQTKVMINGEDFLGDKLIALKTAMDQPEEVWEKWGNKIPIEYENKTFTVKRAKTQYTITCVEEQENGTDV